MVHVYRSILIVILIIPAPGLWSQDFPDSEAIEEQKRKEVERVEVSDTERLREIKKKYDDCSDKVRNARSYSRKYDDYKRTARIRCQMAVLRAIANHQWSDPSVIKSARQYMDGTFERFSRTYNDIRYREYAEEVRGDFDEARSYISRFSEAYKPSIKDISEYLEEDGHRVFLIPDSEKSDSLSRTLYLKEWINKKTNFSFHCLHKNKTPAGWCEIRLMNKDGALAEQYVVSNVHGNLVFQKGSKPWSNWFPQLTNLVAGDLETLSLQPNYKRSILPIIFWFAQHYGSHCESLVKDPRTIAGKVQSVNTRYNTVEDEISYRYVVENELYRLAKEYHDKHVNYQVIGAYAFSEAQNSMRDFFNNSSCEAAAVQNVRSGLLFFARNWEKLKFDSFITNEQQIITAKTEI